MINSVIIKRFRGIRDASLSGCRRVNIVVGENGAGKTSLLEALFLASGPSPEIAVRIKGWRGIAGNRLQGSQAQIEGAMWGDLFHNFERGSSIHVVLDGDADTKRHLTISHSDQRPLLVPLSGRADAPLVGQAPITFRWKGPRDIDYTATPTLENGQLKIPAGPRLPAEVFFFPSNHAYSAEETAERFSTLSKRSQENEVLELFREHFPDVTALSIEVSAGAAMVYAKTKNLPEKVPINLISSGMSKLASILFAIPSHPGCVVLIDEIENGLYYKRLPLIWQTLQTFCRKYDAQVFATTHSAECIKAAASASKGHESEFSLIHAEAANGESHLRQASGDTFARAVASDIEIR